MAKKHVRSVLSVLTGIVITSVFVFAFWPRASLVDLGEVTRAAMRVTIDEEGRTRVHDAYVLSTPLGGRLQRVEVHPGDAVVRNETIVAQMLPGNPVALDIRTREQALTEVTAAEAAVRLARAELNKAGADRDLAQSDLERSRRLRGEAMLSQAELDRAVREARAADAQLSTAEASIAMRQAQLSNARARLISFHNKVPGDDSDSVMQSRETIPLYAPATGRVLRVMQESATTLPAGAGILEIGDTDSDLEVVVELLSSDAVKVSPGDRVILADWGGENTLNGIVERVDPLGFTKFSALGVEEQRVNTIIQFTDPVAARRKLGHGYRVEARIVVWEDENALILPASALFREGQDWAVFKVSASKARLQRVSVGYNNGLQAQLLAGLEPGDQVVLYPTSGLRDGAAVKARPM